LANIENHRRQHTVTPDDLYTEQVDFGHRSWSEEDKMIKTVAVLDRKSSREQRTVRGRLVTATAHAAGPRDQGPAEVEADAGEIFGRL